MKEKSADTFHSTPKEFRHWFKFLTEPRVVCLIAEVSVLKQWVNKQHFLSTARALVFKNTLFHNPPEWY